MDIRCTDDKKVVFPHPESPRSKTWTVALSAISKLCYNADDAKLHEVCGSPPPILPDTVVKD